MFLIKVYRHNKWLFSGMLLFAVAQLLVNAKRGMVFSPWFHYGMYSEVMPVKDTYDVQLVNGSAQLPWAPQAWDKVYLTLWRYQSIDSNKALYHNEVLRLWNKTGMPLPVANNFIIDKHDVGFAQWYPHYLRRYNLPALSANENLWESTQAVWNGELLIPLKKHAGQ